MIDSFRGKWTKLGNYSSCVVFFEGHAYQSVEHAYQAAKFLDDTLRKIVRDQPTPATAKKIARMLAAQHLRHDWEAVNIQIMQTLLREKFCQEPERGILLSTGDEALVEGNWWHDNFWGDCRCGRSTCAAEGENHLGRSLMLVRSEIREEL